MLVMKSIFISILLMGLISCSEKTGTQETDIPTLDNSANYVVNNDSPQKSDIKLCTQEFINDSLHVADTEIAANKVTKEEIVILNDRCIQYFKKYGPDFACTTIVHKPGDSEVKEEILGSHSLKDLCELVKQTYIAMNAR